MAQATPDDVWPPPTFHFNVTLFDGVAASFQEVDGIDTGADATEYRRGRGPDLFPIKSPGPGQVGIVTLHRGSFANDARFRGWVDAVRMNTIARGTVIIALLGEAAIPKMTWTLTNARPTLVTVADLTSEGNEVAVESVEIAYETVAVSTP